MTYRDPIAVIDTNVLLDLYSWHDVHVNFDRKVTWASVAISFDDSETRMRLARAREALLLAIHLHKTRAATFSISEAVRLVNRVAELDGAGKPLDPGERAYREAFIKTFLWLVRERLLFGWQGLMRETDVKGNDADDMLLAYAKEHSLPLITNEGSTPTGINRKNRMRRLAREQGVKLVRAADFYRDEIDEEAEAKAFLQAFRAEAPRYLKSYLAKNTQGRKGIHKILKDLDSYYFLLLGHDSNRLSTKPAKLLMYR